MVTLSELELLLNLNGNKRLIDLEKEIFNCTDINIIYFYLTRMIDYCYHNAGHNYTYGKDTNGYGIKSIYDACWAVYTYSEDILKDRWLEAEHILLNDWFWYNNYKLMHGIYNE